MPVMVSDLVRLANAEIAICIGDVAKVFSSLFMVLSG
jgi:hypothetical protein